MLGFLRTQPEQRKASVGRDEGQEGKAARHTERQKQSSHYCTDLVGNGTPGHPLSHSGSSSMACYSVSSQGGPDK